MAVPTPPFMQTEDVAGPIMRAGQGMGESFATTAKQVQDFSSDMMANRSMRYKAKLESDLGTLQEGNRASEKAIDQAPAVRETESVQAKRERLSNLVASSESLDPKIRGELSTYVSKLTGPELTTVMTNVEAGNASDSFRRGYGLVNTFVDKQDGDQSLLVRAILEPGFAAGIKSRDEQLKKEIVAKEVNDIFSKLGVAEKDVYSPEVFLKFQTALATKMSAATDDGQRRILSMVAEHAGNKDGLAATLSLVYPDKPTPQSNTYNSFSIDTKEKDNFSKAFMDMEDAVQKAIQAAAGEGSPAAKDKILEAARYQNQRLAASEIAGPEKVTPIMAGQAARQLEAMLDPKIIRTVEGLKSLPPVAISYLNARLQRGGLTSAEATRYKVIKGAFGDAGIPFVEDPTPWKIYDTKTQSVKIVRAGQPK